MLNNCCYCDFILLQLKLGKDQVFSLTCYMYISKYSNKTIARNISNYVKAVVMVVGFIQQKMRFHESPTADGQGL